eukprot:464917_1
MEKKKWNIINQMDQIQLTEAIQYYQIQLLLLVMVVIILMQSATQNYIINIFRDICIGRTIFDKRLDKINICVYDICFWIGIWNGNNIWWYRNRMELLETRYRDGTICEFLLAFFFYF